MNLLNPDWNQARPVFSEVQAMCQRISLSPIPFPEEPFQRFLSAMRKTHTNGGAFLAAFTVAPDPVFDWYASRNRLAEERLLDNLLAHPTVRAALPELLIPTKGATDSGFSMSDQFLLDGVMANALFYGGAYWRAEGDGRAEKDLALAVCEAMFGLRFGEVNCNVNNAPWTPWFKGLAWDLTAVVFDRRTRNISLLAVTDTD